MAEKTPLRLVLDGGTPTGIAEYQTGDTIGNSFLTNSSFSVLDNTSTSTSISLGDSLQIIGTGGITTSLTGSVLTIAVGGSIVTETSTDLLTNKTLGATTIAGHLTPDSNEAYDLGSASFKFRDIYLSGSSINLGDATITADGSSIVLPAGTTVSGGSGETVDLNSTQELTNKTVNLSSNTLTGTTAEFNTALSDANFVTQDGSGNVTVSGNLTVNGTTTTVATTNTTISDNLLELNSGAASNANDTGILIERGSTGDNAIIVWDESADKFVVGTTTATASDTGDLTISTGTLVANVEGNVTGDVTGNADTATSLETARTVGGVSFDGTANIDLPGVNTTGNQNTSGNAATATALETARTIAGQSFDGSSNITIASTDLSNSSNITLNDATQTLTNKTFDANGTGNSISNIEVADLATGVLDTDLSTVSASDDTLASAKAIKSYVDSQVTEQDLDLTTDSGTIAIDLDSESLTVAGGTGIDTSGATNTVTINISAGGVDTTQLADSAVTNAKLANSSISFTDESSTAGSVSLGSTLEFLTGEGINTTASGNTLTIAAEEASTSNKGVASFETNDFTVTSGAVSIKSGSIENDDLAGSIANAKLTNSTITIAGNTGSQAIDLGDTLTIQGTTNEIETSQSGDTLTIGLPDNVTVSGNLTVSGTTASVPKLDVDNITINDNTISSTNTDGNISLNPNGAGNIAVNSAKITGLATPTADDDAATKAYVDGAVEGLSIKPAVRVAATTNLSGTYNNGTSGVGATLDLGTAATLTIDGVSSWSLYDGVLLFNQTDATENGRYFISQIGDAGTSWILTRCTYCDEPGEVESMYIFVSEGTQYGGTGWVVVGWDANTDTIGTSNIDFQQFSGAGTYTGGNGLDLTGTTFSVNVDNSTIEIDADDLQVKAGGITDNELATNSVTTAKITNSNVTTDKIANSNVTADKLATNSVTTAKITDENVTAAKLAATLDLSSKTVTLPSSFTTNTGSQTLENKTIDTANNTITIVEADISDLGSYITASSTDTLTNKTFDANGTGNSISNIEVADLAAGVLDTNISSVSASDNTLASAKAIKAYVDNQVGSISTVLTVSDDTSTTDQVTVGTDILNFAGGDGIQTTVSNNTVTIDFTNIDLNA